MHTQAKKQLKFSSNPATSRKLTQALCALLLASHFTACVPVIVGGAAAGGAMAADRRTSGVYVEDQNIELKTTNKIADALGEAAHVSVTSYKGNVLLTGEVPTEAAKATAESMAKATESVRSVTNELTIGMKSSLSSRTNDAYLTSKIKTQFLSENRFPANYVKVVTENSTVYLMGYVTPQEAEAAVEIARNTSGVAKVVKVFELIN